MIASKEQRREAFKTRMAELRKRPPRPTKHTHDFRYKRHIEHFPDISLLGKRVRELRDKGITQIMSAKNIRNGVRLKWYERKLLGPKAVNNDA